MDVIQLARRQFPVRSNRPAAGISSSPKRIAFFDLDRTLLMGSSIAAGLRHLRRERRFIREEIFSLILVRVDALLPRKVAASIETNAFACAAVQLHGDATDMLGLVPGLPFHFDLSQCSSKDP